MLDQYPLAAISTVLVMILVGIFFVSGADAASMVMGTLSERGTITPSKSTVIFWGALTGAVAAIMLILGDGGAAALSGLQGLTIVAALPFALVMAALCLSLWLDLRHDPMILREQMGFELVEEAVVQGVQAHGDDFGLVLESSETDTVPEEFEKVQIPLREGRK